MAVTDLPEARKKAKAVIRGSAIPGETVITSTQDLARLVLDLADEVERLKSPLSCPDVDLSHYCCIVARNGNCLSGRGCP
jgi:hypothetical protein